MTQQNYPNMPFMPANENTMYEEANTPAKSLVEETKTHRALYPELHFKLKPFISATCDAIDAAGKMPSQQELDDITDDIHDEFCKMHPDMANYMNAGDNGNDQPEAVQTIIFDGFRRGGYGRGFRRRGLARDLIGGLLLSELLGRGHRYPYYPYSPYYPYY